MTPSKAELLERAKEELAKSKLTHFCLECGRPRRKNYCPWDAKHPMLMRHLVKLRNEVSVDLQALCFINNRDDRATRHVFK